MTTRRKGMLSFFLGLFLLGHVTVRILNREYWPFSNYPMYSNLFNQERISFLEVWASNERGSLYKLNPSHYFSPYGERALEELFLREKDPQKRQILTAALYRWYQEQRQARDWPALQYLGLYQLSYDFKKLKSLLRDENKVREFRQQPESSQFLTRFPSDS